MNSELKELKYGGLRIDPSGRKVHLPGRIIILAEMEFNTLYFLASNPDSAFTKKEIYHVVAEEKYMNWHGIIDNLIRQIRMKTGIRDIYTIKGYGYKFVSNRRRKK